MLNKNASPPKARFPKARPIAPAPFLKAHFFRKPPVLGFGLRNFFASHGLGQIPSETYSNVGSNFLGDKGRFWK